MKEIAGAQVIKTECPGTMHICNGYTQSKGNLRFNNKFYYIISYFLYASLQTMTPDIKDLFSPILCLLIKSLVNRCIKPTAQKRSKTKLSDKFQIVWTELKLVQNY